jgi:hypothetical protein
MLDSSGALRVVYGVAGSFTLGPPLETDAAPDSENTALQIALGAVYSDRSELIIRRADGSEVRFALSGVRALRTMSADWVQVITASSSYALRVERGHEALFALPAGPIRTNPATSEVRRR